MARCFAFADPLEQGSPEARQEASVPAGLNGPGSRDADAGFQGEEAKNAYIRK